MLPGTQIIDSSGQVAYTSSKENPQATIIALRDKLRASRVEMQRIRARFDAAQTFIGNENHWSNADNLDPHAVASLSVRRMLRSRSRYEVIENNPYLKGTILTIANDFVGSGPKLQITDTRYSKEAKKAIEDRFQEWCKARRIRQKIWRMRVAKVVDGEAFARAYDNPLGNTPVRLDFQVLECDRISSGEFVYNQSLRLTEIDGVRFDKYENPTHYHILHQHPGSSQFDRFAKPNIFTGGSSGDWVKQEFVLHWFRQDRGWLRGIPETAPSLPLCALLRRYTLAMVRHAETAASLSGVIETDGPGTPTQWSEADDPFDIFPVEYGMLMNLPWGYKLKQLAAVPLGDQYDAFVGSILREISRPILAPYNISAGTSKDSNMASGVLDQNIYKGGQMAERHDCEEVVLDRIFELWWREFVLVEEAREIRADRTTKAEIPKHRWTWDRIGLDHTDPAKVATALQILHDKRFYTDRDIQESYFNRSLEEWQADVEADDDFRMELPSAKQEQEMEEKALAVKQQQGGPPGKSGKGKPKSKPKAGSKR